MILKRRADAERDGDRIYAIVRGVGKSGVNRRGPIGAPSAARPCPRHAVRVSRFGRRSRFGHAGRGKRAGRPAAERALLRVLDDVFPPPGYGQRTLGNSPSWIGSATAAAGMAGLIKTALALYHRVLPPTPPAQRRPSLRNRTEFAFAESSRARPWIHAGAMEPRRAGVSAFGAAGTSATPCSRSTRRRPMTAARACSSVGTRRQSYSRRRIGRS